MAVLVGSRLCTLVSLVHASRPFSTIRSKLQSTCRHGHSIPRQTSKHMSACAFYTQSNFKAHVGMCILYPVKLGTWDALIVIIRICLWPCLPKCDDKVGSPYSVTSLNQTTIFEWYEVRCGSKRKYQKVICLKEIGLIYIQNMMYTLGSIVKTIGGTYMTINEHKNLHFDNE